MGPCCVYSRAKGLGPEGASGEKALACGAAVLTIALSGRGHRLIEGSAVNEPTTSPIAPLPSTAETGPHGDCGSSGQEANSGATLLPAIEMPALPGYEVKGVLGKGGMGVVYRARQVGLNRPCAVKMILSPEYAGIDELARFQGEAESLARLRHPHIVQVFEVGSYQGKPFFSLELCEGGTLSRSLSGTPLPDREAALLVQQLAGAMQTAHEARIVHRDLKPANVLFSLRAITSGAPREAAGGSRPPLSSFISKITDFGLAKKLDEGDKTVTGAILGTPSYMPPEQATGKAKRANEEADKATAAGKSMAEEARRALKAEEEARKKAELAKRAEARAKEKADEADQEREKKQQQLDRAEMLAYVGNITLAQAEWQYGEAGLAWKHLESCQWNLRGWEHDYLYTQLSRNDLGRHSRPVYLRGDQRRRQTYRQRQY